MHKQFQQTINPGDRVIIGLGDSYTQGVGAYTKELWDKHKGKIDVFNENPEVIEQQYTNSWVNQLAIKLGYKSINLGHAGTGNRAAFKELYFNPDLLYNVKDAVVIYFLSGIERFDFVSQDLISEHHHFYAMWPNPWDKNASNKKLWEVYAESIHSDRFVATELMLNILEAQEFCRARGFKLIVSPAFDMRINRDWIKNVYRSREGLLIPNKCVIDDSFVDQFDWNQFYVPEGYKSFMELLCELEGDRSLAPGGFYKHFCDLPYPSKYITNCAHPALEGHKVIAEEFYKVISSEN